MRKFLFGLTVDGKMQWLQAAGAGLGMITATLFLPGGDDLYRYYIPFELGCLDCGFVPYFAQWVLAPLRILPGHPLGWTIWTTLSVVGFLFLAYHTRINPVAFMLSFPMIGQVWLGQIDVVICAGMVLFIVGKNPYWRGVGIILALTKPQLAILPLLYALLLESRGDLWRLFLVPVIATAGSLIVYGVGWPVEWLSNALTDLPIHVWRLAGMDIGRYGWILLPVPLLMDTRRRRVEAGFLVAALATPFFGVYSYVAFLLLDSRWWWTALSFTWIFGYFWLGETAMRLAWILPMALLFKLINDMRKERRGFSPAIPT